MFSDIGRKIEEMSISQTSICQKRKLGFYFLYRHNCCLAMEPTKVLLAVVYYQMPEKIEGSSLDREAETAAVVLNQKYQSQTRSEKRM